ncbi:MAG: GFA family protein [Pseudomonadota bacterium]
MRHARCACGQFHLEARDEPLINAVCHCDNCKQRTGSAFGISLYFREADITLHGERQEYALHNHTYDHDQQRFFCPRCGTTLCWKISTLEGQLGVAGGCFTEQFPDRPTVSGTDSKRYDWVTLPPDCERR